MTSSRAAGITIRQATVDDLPDAHRVWRDAIDAYTERLGSQPLPRENPGVMRLHAHCIATDPTRFQVAVRTSIRGEGRVVGFGSAVDRGPLWFLSMLFVDPAEQARGLGKALLGALLPRELDGRVLATCTDAAQPISNGLYATLGIAPRMPMFNCVGYRDAGFEWPQLADGVRAEQVDDHATWAASRELAEFDTQLLGFTHPQDHAFIAAEPRHAFALRNADGSLLGYGYAGEIGRLGPIAVADPALLAPFLGVLLRSVPARGAQAVWIPGAAGAALSTAVQSGLRIEGFPVLASWSRPFTDYGRYVPISPGLV
ncbi:MAG TPA: GNAT family N-acetyltransferase [Candidatus Limnocylindrales bacterium]|nr:GNAT family N-acetyltransferase [Candidatus Limnocylindrales bacterium]